MPQGVAAIVDTALIGPELSAAVMSGGTLMPVRSADEPRGYDRSPHPDVTIRRPWVPDYATGRKDKLDELHDLVRDEVFRPRVADVYPPEQAAEAHRRFDKGGTRGRLVLTF